MSRFPSHLTVAEALPEFFRQYELGDGGYEQKWFCIKFGPVSLWLPNISARVDAAKIHDVHHLLTGYPASLRGEAEIGAWEIAAGCGRYWVAWLLNLGAFAYGIIFFPKALFAAFMRGRKSHTSLYRSADSALNLMEQNLGTLREKVGTDRTDRNTVPDLVIFAGLVSGLLLTGVLVLGLIWQKFST